MHTTHVHMFTQSDLTVTVTSWLTKAIFVQINCHPSLSLSSHQLPCWLLSSLLSPLLFWSLLLLLSRCFMPFLPSIVLAASVFILFYLFRFVLTFPLLLSWVTPALRAIAFVASVASVAPVASVASAASVANVVPVASTVLLLASIMTVPSILSSIMLVNHLLLLLLLLYCLSSIVPSTLSQSFRTFHDSSLVSCHMSLCLPVFLSSCCLPFCFSSIR